MAKPFPKQGTCFGCLADCGVRFMGLMCVHQGCTTLEDLPAVDRSSTPLRARIPWSSRLALDRRLREEGLQGLALRHPRAAQPAGDSRLG